MKDWPTDGVKYLPMDAAEFERLTAATRSRDSAAPTAPPAAVTSARYEAKLVGERLVGHAVLDVSLTGPSPAMLPFEPCNVAVGRATWATASPLPKGEGTEHPAQLGLAADNRLGVLTERSSRLNFDWSLAGRRDSPDTISFLFEIPVAPANQLLLDLPEGFVPTVDRGLIVGSEPAGEDLRRWRIELGGNEHFRLRIVRADAARQRRQLALLRESRTYDCSLRGIDVSVQWKLRVHNEPLEQITVLLDPELQLVSAHLGDAAMAWSVVPAADGAGTRVAIRLPEPIRDTERVVRLTAIGRPTLDRPWRLPRIRAEGPIWQEGAVSLLVSEPLAIDRIVPVRCAQTDAGSLSAPRIGQSMSFQSFDPDSTVEVRLSRRAATVETQSVAAVELDGQQATARVAVQFHVADEARFAIKADVTRRWTIDSVESIPPGGLSDWSIEPRPDGARRLDIRLSAALSPTRPVQLAIAGRRILGPAVERIEIGDLLPVRFRGIDQRKRWIALHTADPLALKLDGDARLHRIKPADLAPDVLSMFAEPPRGLLFEYDDRAASQTVSFVTQKAARPCNAAKASAPIVLIAETPRISACRLESWHPADGVARLVATYEVQPARRKTLRFSLPPEISRNNLRGLRIDGEPVEFVILSAAKNLPRVKESPVILRCAQNDNVEVELPADRKTVRVAVEWTAAGPSLGAFGSLPACAMPQPDLPMPAIHWTACLPPGYAWGGCGIMGDSSSRSRLPGETSRGQDSQESRPADGTYLPVEKESRPADGTYLPVEKESRPADGTYYGWTAQDVDLPAESSATIALRYVRVASMRLFGVVGFLLIAGLGCWIVRRHKAVAGLVALLLVCVGAARAEEPMHRVFVPVDANRKPAGGKVFVPEAFYKELYRRSAAPAQRPSAWLLCDAVYRGELTEESVSGRFVVNALRAQYELQTIERVARVRIPLRTDGANLLPGSVLLDGRAIEPEWEPSAAALTFEVAEPGRHRLELSLRPAMRGADRSSGFDLVIPRVAAARLELALPPNAPTVEVPSACGGVEVAPMMRMGARLSAELGPADRLAVRWREASPANGGRSAVDAEQLIWLKVQPGSVVVAARFNLRVTEGRIEQVQLAVDPKLRLLPLPGDEPPNVQMGSDSGQLRTITLRWPRPISDHVTFDATFLAAGVSAVGKIRLPRVEILGVQPTRRWMAYSVGAALDADERPEEPLETVSVAEFLKAWSGAMGPTDAANSSPNSENGKQPIPRAAYRLPADETGWTLSTRPHEPQVAVDQNLTLSFDEDRAEALFDARISVTSGYVFQHQLNGPKGLKIERVSVMEDDVDRVQRWSQDADGVITVFLNGPASGVQDLSIRGQLPVRRGEKMALPTMGVEKCQVRSATIRLHRRPSLRLTIDPRDTIALGMDAWAGWERKSALPPWNIGGDAADSSQGSSDLGTWVHTIPWDGEKSPPVHVTVEHETAGESEVPKL